MKINLGKVLKLAGRLIVAAPAFIEVVRPVLKKRKPLNQAQIENGQGLKPSAPDERGRTGV